MPPYHRVSTLGGSLTRLSVQQSEDPRVYGSASVAWVGSTELEDDHVSVRELCSVLF